MIDPCTFAKSQKMVWVKQFLDDDYMSAWKCIDIEMFRLFHDDTLLLWKTETCKTLMEVYGGGMSKNA